MDGCGYQDSSLQNKNKYQISLIINQNFLDKEYKILIPSSEFYQLLSSFNKII
jgi:hypothetical protein